MHPNLGTNGKPLPINYPETATGGLIPQHQNRWPAVFDASALNVSDNDSSCQAVTHPPSLNGQNGPLERDL